jgi:hypothetical protein
MYRHLIILALLDIWFFSQGGFLKDNKYYDLTSESKNPGPKDPALVIPRGDLVYWNFN